MRSSCVYSAGAVVAVTFVLCTLAYGSGLLTPSSAMSNVRAPDDSAGAHQSMIRKEENAQSTPFLLGLQRESVPVKRQGKVVSFKTSYSGVIHVGTPLPQEFRVVFDTGSGHIILPSVQCESSTCTKHNRYNGSASATSVRINVDGSPVPADELCDQATIGFGTGQVTGEFVRDVVCLHSDTAKDSTDEPSAATHMPSSTSHCLEMQIVKGVQMTPQPFKSFVFDGIIGLGLSSLALSQNFSFLGRLSQSKFGSKSHFGVFLTEGDDGEESEIAFGGHNQKRLLEPLKWAPVTKQDLGYWQVQILAFRINGRTHEICQDGACRGVMDTGTSHLGIPVPFAASIGEQLTVPAGAIEDCRQIHGPAIEIEIPGFNISLTPENYMRKLPLKEGVNVGSSTGVTLTPAEDAKTTTTTTAMIVDMDDSSVPQWCRPRLMPVNLPAPLGPKLFILGEPVLHRYYTVYDWKDAKIGLGLSASRRNLQDRQGVSLMTMDGDVSSLLQQTVMLKRAWVALADVADEDVDNDEAFMVQVTVNVQTRLVCL